MSGGNHPSSSAGSISVPISAAVACRWHLGALLTSTLWPSRVVYLEWSWNVQSHSSVGGKMTHGTHSV
jgi:hypothetical protein